MIVKRHLPDRTHYTLASVAAEWGTDTEHVIELCAHGRLVPSIRLPAFVGERWVSTAAPVWIDNSTAWDWDGVRKEARVDLPPGVWRLDSYHSMPKNYHDGDEYLDVNDLILRFQNHDLNNWIAVVEMVDSSFRQVRSQDLVISSEEKERFETKQNERPDFSLEDMDTRERSTLLRLIGFLTQALVDESKGQEREISRFEKGRGEINASEIAKAIDRQIDKKSYGGPGIAERTVREKISKSMKLLKSESVDRPE